LMGGKGHLVLTPAGFIASGVTFRFMYFKGVAGKGPDCCAILGIQFIAIRVTLAFRLTCDKGFDSFDSVGSFNRKTLKIESGWIFSFHLFLEKAETGSQSPLVFIFPFFFSFSFLLFAWLSSFSRQYRDESIGGAKETSDDGNSCHFSILTKISKGVDEEEMSL